MNKVYGITGVVFASLVFNLCAQNAFSVERKPFVIEKTGDVSDVRKKAEGECLNGHDNEIAESYESGYRSNIYSNINGYERMVVQTTWKVVCQRRHFEGKMPSFVIAKMYSRTYSTLEPEMRQEIVEAASQNDNNCASKMLKLMKDFKQDSEITSALAELEQLMGPFSVALAGYFGMDSENYLSTSNYNHLDYAYILTPDYEKLGQFHTQQQMGDGTARPHNDWNRISDAGCFVDREDILKLINRVIKEKKALKEQSDVFSKLETKPVERSLASTRVKNAVKSVTASFVESPKLSGGLAQ